jgi:hypothetical protein
MFQRLYFVVLLAIGCAAPLYAQQQPDAAAGTGQDASGGPLDRYLQHLPEVDQGGGLHVTKHLALVFGDIKDGSGAAVGPAISVRFANGAFAQAKGVYSVRHFSLLQALYDSAPFWGGRSVLSSRLRWQNAPRLSLFPLGPDPPLLRLRCGERKTEASAQLVTRFTRALRVGVGVGLEGFATSGGAIDLEEGEPFVPASRVPVPGARPWLAHSFLSATVDTRKSADSRRGTEVDATLHDFRDWRRGAYSFDRVESGVEHLVPIRSRSTFDMVARAWISIAGAGETVPYFLMPTLGGGDYLEAYRLYRFCDRNALWVRGEYRRAVHEMVDVAAFYEAGQVSPSVHAFALRGAPQSAGAGVIFHANTSARLRIDVARGGEGFGFAILLSAGGA